MGGWRRKIVVLLVFYFAGFATAIYFLAPVPEGKAQASSREKSGFVSALKSDEFAKSFNQGLHKCLDYAKDAADYAGDYVHKKLEERKSDS